MTVYLNGRFLTQPVTGVQRFAFEMGVRLRHLMPDLRVLVPRGVAAHQTWPGEVTEVGRLAGHPWEQWDLPRYLRRQGSPLLVNLSNTGPCYYSNQICTQHDINYINHPRSYSIAFRAAYSWMVPRLIAHSRAIITGSEHARADLVRHFSPKSPVHVVYEAAAEVFCVSARGDKIATPFLLAVASNSGHKNLGRLYQAMGRLSDTGVPPLWVVGAGGRSFARTTGSSDIDLRMVQFLGRVSDEELARLYQSAVAFVFPSLHEGFGLPPIEAQACGCPVVSSTASCLPEVLGHSFQPFDPLDVESIALAIHSVVRSEELRLRLRAAGLVNAQRFSWDRSAKRLALIVQDLL